MWRRNAELPDFVGVVHLGALPGSPRATRPLDEVLQRAHFDARALAAGGVDAIIVENFGDSPFEAGAVDAACVAAMTRAVLAVREAAPDVALGVNVLRNDAMAAVGIAAVTGAAFIRVNVLVGAMVTDQGIIQGQARPLLLLRQRLAPDLRIVADVLVKHAVPLGPSRRADVASDTFLRGGADVLVVTGAGTGLATELSDVDEVRAAVPAAPVWVGSGMTPDRARSARGRLDGAIVGTWLHRDGRWDAPVDAERVSVMARALRG